MEQMISNIWNLNALLGGIFVFLLLIVLVLCTLGVIITYPFRKNKE